MRTIWVYKGTPNPPVKPSAFSTEASYLILRGSRLYIKNDYPVTRPSVVGAGEPDVSRLRSS